MIIVKIQGGLGNQLFQYASARRISIINNVPIKLDLETILNTNYPFKYRLDMFNIVEQIASETEIEKLKSIRGNPYLVAFIQKLGIKCIFNKKSHIIEKNTGFPDPKILNCTDEAYLEGWLSSESYFKDIRHLLLNEFTLKNPSDSYNRSLLGEISKCESVAIHIRRGDYAQNTYFGLLPLSYYYKAIQQIKESVSSPVFYIFSNDIKWVKQNLVIDGDLKFIENNSQSKSISYTQADFEDLNLMRFCKHQIIANSTFSWWGAWLNKNPNKKVCYPANWYNDIKAQKLFETNSFIPSEWIKVQF